MADFAAPRALKTEYLDEPLGLATQHPRLSWQLTAATPGKRGLHQRACQVLVASSLERLAQNEGDLWDSGKIETDRSHLFEYAGRPLTSGQRCYWKVRVWDAADQPSPYSEPAWWEMGLLSQEDWHAVPIGSPQPRTTVELGDWIWHPKSVEGWEQVLLRKEFDLEDDDLESAWLFFTAANAARVYLNGVRLGEHGCLRVIAAQDVRPYLRRGRNVLAVEGKHVHGPAGFAGLLEIQPVYGKPLQIFSNDSWRCLRETEPPEGWNLPGFSSKGWKQAKVVFKAGKGPGQGAPRPVRTLAAPRFRKEFFATQAIKSARAYLCGLGCSELYINGERVHEARLDPAQTDYEHRKFYTVHDVTRFLKRGDNCLGVLLGKGWYDQLAVWGGFEYGPPFFLLQVKVEYEDGSSEWWCSDLTWQTTPSEILFNNLYTGEVTDARRIEPGWSLPGFQAAQWQEVVEVEIQPGRLEPQLLPPMKITRKLPAVSLTNPEHGVWIFDLGQNIAGVCELELDVPQGTVLTLRTAEELLPDGRLAPASTGVYATLFVQTETYISSGAPGEKWCPRFTYHGFRYVEVKGYPGKPPSSLVKGCLLHTAVKQHGRFQCSDDVVNRIHQTALWTELTNLHGLPTDCPQREKCGWLGDAHVTCEMTLYNFDMAQFWLKYLGDIRTSLDTDGLPMQIAPGKRDCGKATPDWGTALCQLPWYLYLYLGDERVLEENYDLMQRWCEHLEDLASDGLVSEGLGDWCPPSKLGVERAPVPLTSTAYYYFDLRIMQQVAALLGRAEDSARYAESAEQVKAAFQARFFDYENKTFGHQTSDAFALYLGLVPEGLEQDVAKSLNYDVVERRGLHHTTGITGLRHLYWALGEYGFVETALGLLHQTTYPSHLHLFSLGATTLYETWGEKPPARLAEQVPSRNHPMQGGFDTWFFAGLGGLVPLPEAPGFKRLRLAPHFARSLQAVEVALETPYGLLQSDWHWEGEVLHYHVRLPWNTTAILELPLEDKLAVLEAGLPLAEVEGVTVENTSKGRLVLALESGEYSFTLPAQVEPQAAN